MKTCPICNAVAFDDAATCFGCLHPFGESEASTPVPELQPASDGCLKRDGAKGPAAPPAFFIKMIPVAEESGGVTWSCSVGVGPTAEA